MPLASAPETLTSTAPSPAASDKSSAPGIPSYLTNDYWWAYVHPRAVHIFEREWLVNLILFGNYNRLRDRALDALGQPVAGNTLQVACVYGNLTEKLLQRMAADARLLVADILPVQLDNLARKIRSDSRLTLQRCDSSSMPLADASQDQALLFFLLHEQPEATRRATLRETLRVVKPGGRVVIVDYHRPRALHPLRLLMRQVFKRLEPFAMDLWTHSVQHYLPQDMGYTQVQHRTFFGGLYQLLVLERD